VSWQEGGVGRLRDPGAGDPPRRPAERGVSAACGSRPRLRAFRGPRSATRRGGSDLAERDRLPVVVSGCRAWRRSCVQEHLRLRHQLVGHVAPVPVGPPPAARSPQSPSRNHDVAASASVAASAWPSVNIGVACVLRVAFTGLSVCFGRYQSRTGAVHWADTRSGGPRIDSKPVRSGGAPQGRESCVSRCLRERHPLVIAGSSRRGWMRRTFGDDAGSAAAAPGDRPAPPHGPGGSPLDRRVRGTC
jgi:hypothetical protein